MVYIGWVVALVAAAIAYRLHFARQRVAQALAQAERASAEQLRVVQAEQERVRVEERLAAKEEIDARRRELEAELRERREQVARAEERLVARESAQDQRDGALDQRESDLRSQEALLIRRATEDDERQAAREAELRERRDLVARAEEQLVASAAAQEKRESEVRSQEAALAQRAAQADQRQADLDALQAVRDAQLAQVAGLTREEAREQMLAEALDSVRDRLATETRQLEQEAQQQADHRAREIILASIERCAVEQVAESSVAVVTLPHDEAKGRIIGREGRNVRSFEQLTGVDLVIDDTPETVVISSFDPLRREIARQALTMLVDDGRIHPGRIEEVVGKAQRDVADLIQSEAEAAVFEAGVGPVPAALLTLLGQLRFRTSYSQNVLRHSLEVSKLAGLLADELGAKTYVARRAGLLHDIGKAADADATGPHALVGAELARAAGESAEVCLAIEAHHHEVEANTPEALLVHIADAMSASRPGARRASEANYLRRLENLEELARDFAGVERAYAIQAGREVRVLVRPDEVGDVAAAELARALAERIQSELAYPGQIKVTVIREQRAVEFAR